MTIMNVAAMTTGSTLTAAQATVIPEPVANAINQLSANQTAIMSQMAAMNLNYRVPTQATQQYASPILSPIQQLTIPAMQPFTNAATERFQVGAYGGVGRGGRSRGCNRHGGGRNGHHLQIISRGNKEAVNAALED